MTTERVTPMMYFWRDVQERSLPIERCPANAMSRPDDWDNGEQFQCEMIAGHSGPHVSGNLRWAEVPTPAEKGEVGK